tara:strand:- start:8127 stop:8759 length:633 start_codon:yes stop_codon:yes gene_type:complete
VIKFAVKIASVVLLKKVNGIDNVPKTGGYILAANHSSYMDIPAMYIVFLDKKNTYIRFIAKKSLLKDSFFKTFAALFETERNKVILLDEKNIEKTFKEATKALKKGEVVGIYPEGTRSPTGKIQEGKTGVARLALAAKVPVLPIGINGTFELMPKGQSKIKLKKIITLNIGKPIYLDKYNIKEINNKSLKKATRLIMRRIAGLIGQKYNY